MEVLAYLNNNRWIVDCPKCGKLGATLAEPDISVSPYSAIDGKYICPNCYPGMTKIKERGYAKVSFDEDARAEARTRAEENGEVYDVVFPDNKSEIIDVVKVRKHQHQNWQPGETIKFLKDENKKNGVK